MGRKFIPSEAMRVISWIGEGGQNLRALRSLYNGIMGLMSPDVAWTRESLARVAWQLHLYADKCRGMAERAERVSRRLGDAHGYQITEGGTVYPSLVEAIEITTDWKEVTNLELARGEERVDRR